MWEQATDLWQPQNGLLALSTESALGKHRGFYRRNLVCECGMAWRLVKKT